MLRRIGICLSGLAWRASQGGLQSEYRVILKPTDALDGSRFWHVRYIFMLTRGGLRYLVAYLHIGRARYLGYSGIRASV
jgi:hypothetical protein